MYSAEELREIHRRLAEPFLEEAVERTSGSKTKKGYDTTGIKYQYIVNRLNEVLGVGGFRVEREFSLRPKETRNGYPMVEVTCDLTMQLGQWVDGEFMAFAEATGTGGHTSGNEADAKKGAFTNGFKKVAAFFGCGWHAYAGVIDDDNVPAGQDIDSPNPSRASNNKATPRQANKRASPTTKGRVTASQLKKMRELVAELGGEWKGYRDHVKEKHGLNVEYVDRQMGSNLIDGLLASVRKARGNGSAASAP